MEGQVPFVGVHLPPNFKTCTSRYYLKKNMENMAPMENHIPLTYGKCLPPTEYHSSPGTNHIAM